MGELKRVSAAVVVDGKYGKDADGKETYTPRSAAELKQLTHLVKSVVGFQENRGDVVTVVNLRFAKAEFMSDEEGIVSRMGLHRRDWVRIIEAGILGLVVLLIFLFVFRPYIGKIVGFGTGLSGAVAGTSGTPMTPPPLMPGMMGSTELAPSLRDKTSPPPLSSEGLTSGDDSIVLQERLSRLETVEELIRKQPENAALIVRIWMKR
jgi:flagellar M-ring protein FliF